MVSAAGAFVGGEHHLNIFSLPPALSAPLIYDLRREDQHWSPAAPPPHPRPLSDAEEIEQWHPQLSPNGFPLGSMADASAMLTTAMTKTMVHGSNPPSGYPFQGTTNIIPNTNYKVKSNKAITTFYDLGKFTK